jgi:PAT family beta-lactamase induction signal transducer AmpG
LPVRLPVLKESTGLRYFAFLYLYIMQGIPSGFALTAMANYLAGRGLSSHAIGTFVAIVGIPWVVQFVWGPIIDRYQYSVIGHRKQWVVLTQLVAFVASLSLLLVHDPAGQVGLMSAVFFIHSIFASVQDASVDAIAIAIVPDRERGRVNAFMRGGYLLGIAIGSAGLSTVLHHYGFRQAALVQSALLLAMTVLTFFIKLDSADQLIPRFGKFARPDVGHQEENPSLAWLFKELYKGIAERSNLQTFGIIALVYCCGSIFIRSFSYYTIHNLHWADQQISVLQGGWGTLATVLVTITGGVVADRIGPAKLQLRVMLALCAFLIIFNSLGFLWGHRPVTVAGLILWNFADPMFSVAAMPVLMALCRQKVEGSQFTTYMAMVNFCDVVGSYVSGWALTLITAPHLGLICGGLILTACLITIYRQRTKKAQLDFNKLVTDKS